MKIIFINVNTDGKYCKILQNRITKINLYNFEISIYNYEISIYNFEISLYNYENLCNFKIPNVNFQCICGNF